MFTQTLRRQLRATPVDVIEVFPPGLPTNLAQDLEVGGGGGASTDVIAEVAAEICARIVDGTEVILPHTQSRRLYAALPEMDPGFIDTVNNGVKRRPGWDQRQSAVVNKIASHASPCRSDLP